MHVPITSTNAEVSGAKAQSLGYVVLLATTTAISGFLFGFDTAVINGVLLLLRRQFALSNLQTEVAASSLLLGCLLGAAGASMDSREALNLMSDFLSELEEKTGLIKRVRWNLADGDALEDRLMELIQGHGMTFRCRNFSFQKPRDNGFAQPTGNCYRDIVCLSRQLADCPFRRKQLEMDAGGRRYSITCILPGTPRNPGESALVVEPGTSRRRRTYPGEDFRRDRRSRTGASGRESSRIRRRIMA